MNKIIKWFKYEAPFTKLWNEYHNPFYIWWKCRKWFNVPYTHFYCGKITWFFGMPISKYKYNRVFDFRMSALGWKWKYAHVEHEWDPYIVFTVFRKWQIMWVFNYIHKDDELSNTRNIATWEAMLDMLFNNKSLNYVIKAHQWGTLDDQIIDIKNNLTWHGYLKYKENENCSDK